MFFEKYVNLCNSKNLSPSAAAEKIGLSSAAPSGWKKGASPRGANLQKIAIFFDVPVEYFDEEVNDNELKKPLVSEDTRDMLQRKINLLSLDEVAQIERQVDAMIIGRLSASK